VGLKPEAGRAERGRGADSESESESEAHKGGRREPASELQSKFREAPSGSPGCAETTRARTGY